MQHWSGTSDQKVICLRTPRTDACFNVRRIRPKLRHCSGTWYCMLRFFLLILSNAFENILPLRKLVNIWDLGFRIDNLPSAIHNSIDHHGYHNSFLTWNEPHATPGCSQWNSQCIGPLMIFSLSPLTYKGNPSHASIPVQRSPAINSHCCICTRDAVQRSSWSDLVWLVSVTALQTVLYCPSVHPTIHI